MSRHTHNRHTQPYNTNMIILASQPASMTRTKRQNTTVKTTSNNYSHNNAQKEKKEWDNINRRERKKERETESYTATVLNKGHRTIWT